MTRILQRAIDKAEQLPADAQRQLAKQLLDEIEGELKWEESLAKSQDALEKLAKKALAAKRKGNVVRKGFDEL
ncbi:MAG TPA: hypothetical protein VMD30_04435 [Tepidisphaeraceae bacterium]|nr:hypothetical protein [Tepidisphaeraceae bacterium]